MYVADIADDCLLGIDFLRLTDFRDAFESTLGLNSSAGGKPLLCSRVAGASYEVPRLLEELFEESSEGLDQPQSAALAGFLDEFQDVFSEEIVAGNCAVVQHSIDVGDSLPIKQAPRRIPLHLREEVEGELERMKNHGVIEKSRSPWVSPAVMVRKKDGTIRFCVDYRKLNAVTRKDSYPLPRIDNILDQLSGNSWFSTLDLKSGYWQVKIHPQDREKTAFSIGKGLWQFTVLPFGLCNAPATFERLMEEVLGDYLSKICLVYLDDVIIFGKSYEEMLQNLNKVFLRIREVNLRVNPRKCVLFRRSVKYLGHVVSCEGVSTDPEKVSAVKDWPQPHNKKQLRSFLGFSSYYRRFVKGFSSLAKPLYELTGNNIKFIWSEECRCAFEKLKEVLSSSPVLACPREEGEFVLDTDASGIGIGAVLSQRFEGSERVIAFFSRVLNKAERNYCVTRRELLAVVDSLRFFRHYLLGRKFLIRTDHVSLRWLMSFKDLEGQLARWLERLQQYDFEILYRKGRIHGNADGLSRRPCESLGCTYCLKREEEDNVETKATLSRILLDGGNLGQWRRDQRDDPEIAELCRGKELGIRPLRSNAMSVSAQIYWSYWDALVLESGVLYKRWYSPNLKSSFLQLVIPRNRIKEILEEAHDSSSGGHFGVNKTLGKIRKRFFWATCKRDVEDWCRSCRVCVARKGPSGKGKSPLQIYNVGTPFERVQVDVLGPLPTSFAGNKYLLVVIDCFSKWVEAFPLKNVRAKTVAEIFVNQVVSRHGIPGEVHTDQGRNFESKLFAEIMALLGIKKTRTTPLHPQSDGQVERQHRTILDYLAKFISKSQRDWDRWIPMFLLAYRSSVHETTGVTPAELCFGRDLRLPLDLLRGSPPVSRGEGAEFSRRLKTKLGLIHSDVRERIKTKSSRMKLRYDRGVRQFSFSENQKVWLFNPRRELGKAPKLQSSWEGPFVVVRKLNDVVFCIRKLSGFRSKIVHADRLAPFIERDVLETGYRGLGK